MRDHIPSDRIKDIYNGLVKEIMAYGMSRKEAEEEFKNSLAFPTHNRPKLTLIKGGKA